MSVSLLPLPMSISSLAAISLSNPVSAPTVTWSLPSEVQISVGVKAWMLFTSNSSVPEPRRIFRSSMLPASTPDSLRPYVMVPLMPAPVNVDLDSVDSFKVLSPESSMLSVSEPLPPMMLIEPWMALRVPLAFGA